MINAQEKLSINESFIDVGFGARVLLHDETSLLTV